MKNEIFVFENASGQTARVLRLDTETFFAVFLRSTKKLEFVSDLKSLDEQNIKYDLIGKLIASELRKKPALIGKFGTLRYTASLPPVAPEVELEPEDEKTFPLFMKYSAGTHALALILVLLSAWIYNRFVSDTVKPITVQVFEQKRDAKEVQEFVNASRKKIVPQKTKARSANRTVVAKNKVSKRSHSSKKVVTRPGNSLSNRGALAVLGGMANGRAGASGLRVNSKSSSAGIGYGGQAAKGGLSRGMIGKGLVQSGIGNGGSAQGYGGYGTRGKGGGQAGYGAQNIGGGSSSAYFAPLGDESLVEGGLDQDQINAVVQRNLGQVIYCYEQGLQTKPSLSGRVAVKFVIGANGAVNYANIASTSLASTKVESCIVKKLKNWTFPRPVGEVNVQVTYPFLLKRLSQS